MAVDTGCVSPAQSTAAFTPGSEQPSWLHVSIAASPANNTHVQCTDVPQDRSLNLSARLQHHLHGP